MTRLRDFWRARSGLQKVGLVVVAVIVLGYVGAVIVDNARMNGSGSESSRCVPVDASVVDAIATGLTGEGDSLRRPAYAVRSNDYEQVYFVAAQIDAPGITGSNVAIWVTNRIDDVDGPIFTVDSTAANFTNWGFASEAEITIDRDGVSEAEDCVRADD